MHFSVVFGVVRKLGAFAISIRHNRSLVTVHIIQVVTLTGHDLTGRNLSESNDQCPCSDTFDSIQSLFYFNNHGYFCDTRTMQTFTDQLVFKPLTGLR